MLLAWRLWYYLVRGGGIVREGDCVSGLVGLVHDCLDMEGRTLDPRILVVGAAGETIRELKPVNL